MNLLKFFSRTKRSKDVAKERLKLVLVHDRANVSPEFLEMMRGEIIKVISRYMDIEENLLDIQVTRAYGVKSGAQWHKATKATKNAIHFATRLYTCCLKRDAEQGGLDYWSLALTNLEKTGAQAAQFFFEGDEFVGFNTTLNDYLNRMYTTFMDRQPAASEIEYWVGEVKAGRQNRHSILAFFAQSPEFSGICKKYGIDRGEIG